MKSVHKIEMDMSRCIGKFVSPIDVMQDDKYSRDIQVTLLSNGNQLDISGCTAQIFFAKADGTGGAYDTLPDKTKAYTISKNVLTISLAPQVCTAVGEVKLVVAIVQGNSHLHTFEITLNVHRKPGLEAVSENYIKILGMLPDAGWPANKYLGTDETGKVVARNESGDIVCYTPQTLSSEQQAQARENIGAASSDNVPEFHGVPDAESFNHLTANLGQGFYHVNRSNFYDLPGSDDSATTFVLFVVSYRENYNLHIAHSIHSDMVAYRIVNSSTGEVHKDWFEQTAWIAAIAKKTEYDNEVEKDITGDLTIEQDWYYSTSKTKANVANNGHSCTNLIPVKQGDKFKITSKYGFNIPLVAEFDSSQTMQSYSVTADTTTVATDCEYIVPANVSYIAINNRNYGVFKVIRVVKVDVKWRIGILEESVASLDAQHSQAVRYTEQELGDGQKAQARENIGAAEAASLGSMMLLADMTDALTVEVGTIGNNGATNPARTQGRYTVPFPVKAGEVYHVWGSYNKLSGLIALYDKDMIFIGLAVESTVSAATVAENYIYTVPDTMTDASGNQRKVAYMGCSTYTHGDGVSQMRLAVKKETVKYNTGADLVEKATGSAVKKQDKVLRSPNGAQWVLTISNDGTLTPLKLRAKADEVDTAITLPENLGAGTYTLKYEDTNGALPDYLDICSLEVATDSETVSYSGLIAENCAPEGATAIGVYDAAGNRVAGIDLGFLGNQYSGKLYSFGAISDVHIGQADSVEDFTNAVAYFDANRDIEFVTVSGDMVDNSSSKSQLEAYQSIVKTAKKPIRVTTGNHEALNYASGEDFDDIKPYFAQDKYPEINQQLYYSFSHNDDVFIMVGVYGSYNNNLTFSVEELQWLYETLEINRNKRCFLFMHYFPQDGSGDAVGCYKSDGLDGSRGDAFLSLMRHYKNVIYFHGHSHAMFKVQELNAMNTIDTKYGRYSVHIPSLTWPTYPNEEGDEYFKNSAAGEGYIVDVYEHGIALRGRDFESGAFSPIGSYYLDTVIEEIPANSFRDHTGTLSTPI